VTERNVTIRWSIAPSEAVIVPSVTRASTYLPTSHPLQCAGLSRRSLSRIFLIFKASILVHLVFTLEPSLFIDLAMKSDLFLSNKLDKRLILKGWELVE
jgi:hypothetical protein